jgi:hypothetical protein
VLALWVAWALASPLALAAPAAARPGDSERAFVAETRGRLERQIRAVAPGTTACLPTEPVPPLFPFRSAVVVYLLYHPTNDFEGRHVRFVSSDPATLALRARGGRLRELLSPPEACPGA